VITASPHQSRNAGAMPNNRRSIDSRLRTANRAHDRPNRPRKIRLPIANRFICSTCNSPKNGFSARNSCREKMIPSPCASASRLHHARQFLQRAGIFQSVVQRRTGEYQIEFAVAQHI
jgi:hypothetical protein